MSDTPKVGLKSPFEIGAMLVGTCARLTLTVVSIPLVVLPTNTRRRVRRAMAEAAQAVIVLPKELANASERMVDEVFAAPPMTLPSLPNLPNLTLPSPEKVGERARAFTERLSKAAEEFGATVGKATSRAADGVEKAAAKVDEWVEKPPTTPKG